MASVTERLAALNQADLSALRAKLEAYRADLEALLKTRLEADRPVTAAELIQAAQSQGFTPEALLDYLERARGVS